MRFRFVVLGLLGGLAVAVGACGGGEMEASGGVAAGQTAPTVSFHADVEPLLQKRCVSCHHEAGEGGDPSAGLGPFSLLTYDQARRYASAIAQQTETRTMPPFGARKTDECSPRLPFMDDATLSDVEIAMLRSWLDQGAPKGDPKMAPAPISLKAGAGLSTVTHTLRPEAPYEVVSGGKDEFRCFVLDPNFADDAWISGVNVVPQNALVTHHVVVYVDEERESLSRVAKVGDSYPCFGGPDLKNTQLLSAWAPGARAMDFGDKAAVQVKKGSLIVSQMHYHPRGDRNELDQTALELNQLPKKPDWQAIVALIGNAESADDAVKLLPGKNDPNGKPAFVIPPGVRDHVEEMTFTFTSDILPKFVDLRVATVGTHMHWVGRDMKVSLERAEPDPAADRPASECLVQTPSWDFNWQRGYRYDAEFDKLPVIHTGDTLRMRCTYDNTMDNPFVRRALSDMHVTAPQEVKLGETTLDEMCLGAFVFLVKP